MNHFFCKIFPKILTILFLFNVLSYSQDVIMLNFQRLSKDNGLSSYGPYAVLKDSRGFVWVATQNGLNRYDGSGFKLYTHDKKNPYSISDDYVTCLCEDSDGNIWAGTMGNGLNKLDRKTEKFELFSYDQNNENSLNSNNIRALIFDDGKLYIGTQNGGMNILDIKAGKFIRLKNNPNNPLSLSNNFIWTLYKDSDGIIWIGTNGNGLNKFDKSNNTFTRFENNIYNPSSISHNEVRTVYEDKDKNLWIGTNGGGLNKFDKKTGKFKRFSYGIDKNNSSENVVVMGITQDEKGNIWIGEYLKGLSIYDPVNDKFTRVMNYVDDKIPVLDGVFGLYKDNAGIIWICHEGKGVYVYNNKKPRFGLYKNEPGNPNSLSDNIIWTFTEDNSGSIWIANRKGLSIFNPVTKIFKNLEHNPNDINSISDNSIRTIFRDRNSIIWLSSNISTLDIYNQQTKKFTHYYSHPDDTSKVIANVAAMIEDKDGILWMGTYSDGLKSFNKDRTQVKTYIHDDNDPKSLSSNGIWNLCLDNDDNLWVCTYTTGLDKFDKRSGTFINFRNDLKDTNSISSNIPSFLFQDKMGIYWITTFGGGLDRFDAKSSTFRHFTTSDGLPDNYLYGFIEDDFGKFWISSNQGLSRFDPKTEKFVNYNIGDGLQSQEFNQNSFFKSSTGEFYFGGMGGFNVFRPSDFGDNNSMPSLEFTSFKIFNKEADLPYSISESESVELFYKDNFFAIEYAAIEYNNPTKIEYAYMLEGVDEKWNYVKNTRSAHYTNVNPGSYNFKVKSTNTDGVWNEKIKTIKIVINPPWWQKWWFRVMLGIIFAGFIFLGVNKKITNMKKEKAEREEFTRKLIESQEMERKKIAAELHDSLGQDLIIIKNNANMALNSPDLNGNAEKFIMQISDISASALNNVRAISHNLRPVELDKLGLTETIRSLVEILSSSSNIDFSTDIDLIDNVLEKSNEVNYCRIIQECLNNILKHSKASNASIQIKVSENEVLTIIKDNGTGFNFESLKSDPDKTIFGLTGIKERVKILNGTLKINSRPDKGTEIIITNPYKI